MNFNCNAYPPIDDMEFIGIDWIIRPASHVSFKNIFSHVLNMYVPLLTRISEARNRTNFSPAAVAGIR